MPLRRGVSDAAVPRYYAVPPASPFRVENISPKNSYFEFAETPEIRVGDRQLLGRRESSLMPPMPRQSSFTRAVGTGVSTVGCVMLVAMPMGVILGMYIALNYMMPKPHTEF